MFALRRIIKQNRISLTERTIESRREKYDIAVNPVKAFLSVAMDEESTESSMITKAALYEAYKHFCNEHKLAIISIGPFGKRLIKEGILEFRETTGKRRTLWMGIKLTEEYLKIVTEFNGRQTSLEDLV